VRPIPCWAFTGLVGNSGGKFGRVPVYGGLDLRRPPHPSPLWPHRPQTWRRGASCSRRFVVDDPRESVQRLSAAAWADFLLARASGRVRDLRHRYSNHPGLRGARSGRCSAIVASAARHLCGISAARSVELVGEGIRLTIRAGPVGTGGFSLGVRHRLRAVC